MKHNKRGHCFWRGMLLFGNAVVYETIIQKYFDDRFQNETGGSDLHFSLGLDLSFVCETRGQTYILV